MKNCIHCSNKIEDNATFCSACGNKQIETYTFTYEKGNMTDQQFIDYINNQLAQNQKLNNILCEFDAKDGGLIKAKIKLNSFKIQYEIAEEPSEYQYALAFCKKTGLVRKTKEQIIAKWQQSNPHCTVVNAISSSRSCGEPGSVLLNGAGAINSIQVYIFYKFKRI